MKNPVKIIGLVTLGILVAFGAFIWNWQRPIIFFDESKIPKNLVTSMPVEFERIYKISKFRSEAGHDYSNTWNGETCRSMKHYINDGRNMDQVTRMPIRSFPTADQPNIKIFAPFDGTITDISSEQTPIGKQVHVRSNLYPDYFGRLFHIDLLPEFNKVGVKVASGQQIGTIGPKDGTDFSIEANILFKGPVLLSLFDEMTDAAFIPFANMGFKREDFIISREYRDAHPLKCGGGHNNEGFLRDQSYDFNSDFIFLKEDPFPNPGAKPVHIGPLQK